MRQLAAAVALGVVTLLAGSALSAQGTTVDNAVARARALVEAGDGRAGRVVLDSLVRSAGVATPALGELLYWRGLLAESSADAERDWRRLLLEVPMSPRAEDALLRLAQLEQLRGRPAASRTHLERLAREYPQAASQARAHFWLAKAYFEEDDRPRACGALDVVRRQVPDNAVELRAQAEDLRARCRGVTAVAPLALTPAPVVASAPRTAAPEERAVASDAARDLRDALVRDSLVRDSLVRDSLVRDSLVRDSRVRDSVARLAATRDSIARDSIARDSIARDAQRRDSIARAQTVAATPPAATPPAATPPAATPPASSARPANARYSVQLAALATTAQAEAMAARFRSRGLEVRIDGTTAPFRVRTGYFATRAQANARLAELKTRGFDGFVAELTP